MCLLCLEFFGWRGKGCLTGALRGEFAEHTWCFPRRSGLVAFSGGVRGRHYAANVARTVLEEMPMISIVQET